MPNAGGQRPDTSWANKALAKLFVHSMKSVAGGKGHPVKKEAVRQFDAALKTVTSSPTGGRASEKVGRIADQSVAAVIGSVARSTGDRRFLDQRGNGNAKTRDRAVVR